MTRVIVAKIDREPALVRIGLENIEHWTRQKEGYLPPGHGEWKELIETHPWQRLHETLLEESDEVLGQPARRPSTRSLSDTRPSKPVSLGNSCLTGTNAGPREARGDQSGTAGSTNPRAGHRTLRNFAGDKRTTGRHPGVERILEQKEVAVERLRILDGAPWHGRRPYETTHFTRRLRLLPRRLDVLRWW